MRPASKKAARRKDLPDELLAVIAGLANDPKSTIGISRGFAQGTIAQVAKDEKGRPRFNAEQAWAFIQATVLRRNVLILGGASHAGDKRGATTHVYARQHKGMACNKCCASRRRTSFRMPFVVDDRIDEGHLPPVAVGRVADVREKRRHARMRWLDESPPRDLCTGRPRVSD